MTETTGRSGEGSMLLSRAMLHFEAEAPRRAASGTSTPLGHVRQAINEVVSRRRLIRYLVQAEMKKRGSDTLLGNLWWVLDPLLQMTVYVIFVSVIARRPAPDYPLFIFAAILPWKWFTSVINDASGSVVRQDRLIRQIAFPKLVLPVATTTAGIVGFVWGLIPLFLVMLLYPHRLSAMAVWFPVIAAVQAVFTLAIAIFVSAANVFFRDLGNALGHGLRLWWFLSPGLYSLAALRETDFVKEHQWIATVAALNPFATLFEAYRSVIYGSADGTGPPHPPDLLSLVSLLVGSVILLSACVMFFKRVEPEFAKVL